MEKNKVFIAYPSSPPQVGSTILSASDELSRLGRFASVQPWPDLNIAGQFISEKVLEGIDNSNLFVADITFPNFNVAFEIGYAIGKRKTIALTKYTPVSDNDEMVRLGLFDAVGIIDYQNSQDLVRALKGAECTHQIPVPQDVTRDSPVFIVEPKYKTDWSNRVIARVRTASLPYRSYDPNEVPRLHMYHAIEQVGRSHGVIVQFIPKLENDAGNNNIRAALVAGLAFGLGKELLMFQFGDDPVPVDYQHLVKVITFPAMIDECVADFAPKVFEKLFAFGLEPTEDAGDALADLDIGASSAENELRKLPAYYLRTDESNRVIAGEVRLVVGRKGSGKTAVFARAKERTEADSDAVVLAIQPEGFSLLKFKDKVRQLLDDGSYEHTLTAIWDFLLLVEIASRLLENDKERYLRDHRLTDPYVKLDRALKATSYQRVGDFHERMSTLLTRVANDYAKEFAKGESATLSSSDITRLIYHGEIRALLSAISRYVQYKTEVRILIDNLDKGWPTHGISPDDVIIIRTLMDATRKVQRQVGTDDATCNASVFLRNDVYEMLVQETSDRGKESKVLLDWRDPAQLRELLRRRLEYSFDTKKGELDELWNRICVSHIHGEESISYMLARSLMRPRYLIDLINSCKSVAVNLQHSKIEASDAMTGYKIYSRSLVTDIDFEIGDIYGGHVDFLASLLGATTELSETDIKERLIRCGIDESEGQRVLELFLWYGVLGVNLMDGKESRYIFDFGYDFNAMKALIRMKADDGVMYAINVAFWAGLDVQRIGGVKQ